jgi:hypothetical protein
MNKRKEKNSKTYQIITGIIAIIIIAAMILSAITF